MNCQRIYCFGQGKNYVEVWHWQEFCASGFDPILSFVALTLGAMPVAAGIVTDSDFSTTIASMDMTSQFGCSAFFNGVKRA